MKTISSGIHHLAILSSRCAEIDCFVTPPAATTTSNGRSSHVGCGIPITAASTTPGHPIARFSISIELIHSPPDLMTSFARSVSRMSLSLPMVARSPVLNQPSSNNGYYGEEKPLLEDGWFNTGEPVTMGGH